MMIGREKGRFRYVRDKIVLGHVGDGVEQCLLCLFVVDTRADSQSRREQRPLPVSQTIDASGDEAERGLEKRNDIVELIF
jgi:hypothetical protein